MFLNFYHNSNKTKKDLHGGLSQRLIKDLGSLSLGMGKIRLWTLAP